MAAMHNAPGRHAQSHAECVHNSAGTHAQRPAVSMHFFDGIRNVTSALTKCRSIDFQFAQLIVLYLPYLIASHSNKTNFVEKVQHGK